MQVPAEQIRTREVLEWSGVHLLHFQGSSCSQKVRILLSEKGISWQSHPVDLPRHANTRPWFLGINARGVVPVLVDDGVVHVESNDILEYLDAQLPSGAQPFFPQTDEERATVRTSLALEDSLHMDLRNITMAFLVPRALAKKPSKTLDAFAQGGAPDARREREVAWWRDFAAQGVTPNQVRDSAAAFEAAFEQLEKRLADGPWLMGERISVLEIAWYISVHRVATAGYPLERHPRLAAHYEMLRQRPAFAREVEGRGLPGLVLGLYGGLRRITGRTLGDALRAYAGEER